MKLLAAVMMMTYFMFTGCTKSVVAPDLTAPSPPQGISTSTGDNFIEIFWVHNTEPDLAGYHVYVSSSLDGNYTFLTSTRNPYFMDNGARNGSTYYYSLTAYDVAGNESSPSHEVAYDTPRPEGYNVEAYDYRTTPLLAGYDFSTYSIGPYDDRYTDVYYEYFQGRYYLDVWTDLDIQDMGYTNTLYDIQSAPAAGWAPTKDAQLIVGHTYVIWTWDNHFAKLRVTAVTPSRVTFDWAYQLDRGNTRLKTVIRSTRGLHEMGSGAKSRMSGLL